MSTKLAKQQLSQLLQSREQPVNKDLTKTIKKRRKQHKKQQTKLQANKQKQQSTYKQNLEYFKSTAAASKETAELMSKVGQCGHVSDTSPGACVAVALVLTVAAICCCCSCSASLRQKRTIRT